MRHGGEAAAHGIGVVQALARFGRRRKPRLSPKALIQKVSRRMRIEFKCYPQLEAILPKPVPAKRMTPEWLKSMPMVADDRDLGEEMPTVKQCPPFIDAVTAGFMLLLPLLTLRLKWLNYFLPFE